MLATLLNNKDHPDKGQPLFNRIFSYYFYFRTNILHTHT